MVGQQIKEFYSNIRFPGLYSKTDLDAYGSRPKNRYLSFIYDHLDHGQEILDAGCGTGLITNTFAARFNSGFTAVDFADSIHYGRQYAERHGFDRVSWIQADLTTWRPSRTYDRVICQGVLHHIPLYQQALYTLKRSVKPGGMLLLGLYNPYGKVLKKWYRLRYHDAILHQDQEHNPFEMSFTVQQVLDMCHDLAFVAATPWYGTKYLTDLGQLCNSHNGGLILYAFRRSHDV